MRKTTGSSRIYIIGAGLAGTAIAKEIQEKGIFGSVAAFLDDDPGKIGTKLMGVPVLGPIRDVLPVLGNRPHDEALIAMPGASRMVLKGIYEALKQAGFGRIRILPTISQILDGEAHLIQTKEIDPADLLPREPLTINLSEALRYLRGKRVLITGAGGSIGSELARQLLFGGVQRLYLLGHGENSIYEIDRELRLLQKEGVGEKAAVVPIIGELQDRDFMFYILERLRADVVFHCAAHKHVPLMEANPVEAIKNNVFGTRNLVDAARAAGTQRFVFVSTDKAADPVSVYGCSKRIAEEIVLSSDGEVCAYMVVRFGNVLGSRGSIMPLFKEQILTGGPVTITTPGTTRFFMTIPEAASLILKAGGVTEKGALFVLDMGKPIRIQDLAEQMIRFYGFEPHRDIPIEYIGLRPGEKEHETLTAEDEELKPTPYPGILQVVRNGGANLPVERIVEELRPICFRMPGKEYLYRNREHLSEVLATYFSSYRVLVRRSA
ncbi:polysaccharide biosynthesis protein CapD [Spirochaeta thermophila DSM 6578]|uniref:Polysaccharide biosynthesis protein CapD n=1 Tax=Winmispira thermophila (strain ATCC 700085 / DSM 6578 / Z-1203) TaxID=869211 RepID=G0GFS7_WINT7|nr:nucleoside-diphosphate sugar epimerase/dehydratase [Spirochaeta thermophila]AEJ61620.1 polysaccharide biosynthesis protein CapD [Spirochaeta thermophila DSM 6578]